MRQQIEQAITNLQTLLDADSTESQFQAWFSQHPVAFDVLGYKNPIEHPELSYENNRYIPDFMAQTLNSEWEIIELKTADASILKDTDRRHAFFALMESNLSQCREYSLIFYDTACRNKFNNDYKTICHKSPAVKLVIGRSCAEDRLLVNELLSGRSPRITVITYDDVINHLKARYEILCGSVINPSGIYILLVATQIKTDSKDEMYIVDVCQRSSKSRIRLFISESNLIMQTDDATGLTVSRMLNQLSNIYSINAYEVEILPLRYETIITLSLGGMLVFETKVRNTDFDFSGEIDMVFGSDQTGSEKSSMTTGGTVIIKGVVSQDDKIILRTYLENFVDENEKRYLHEYIGHKYLHNQGHQILGNNKVYSSNMIQEIDEFKPILRYL